MKDWQKPLRPHCTGLEFRALALTLRLDEEQRWRTRRSLFCNDNLREKTQYMKTIVYGSREKRAGIR